MDSRDPVREIILRARLKKALELEQWLRKEWWTRIGCLVWRQLCHQICLDEGIWTKVGSFVREQRIDDYL